MSISERENFIRALTFGKPEWVPIAQHMMGFYPATWQKYGEQLRELVMRHPLVFPDYELASADSHTGPEAYQEGYHSDSWGSVWYTAPGHTGLSGQVVRPALADWGALAHFRAPDPNTDEWGGHRDWGKIRRDTEARRAQGKLTWGYAGDLFDRLYYLRGFENLMMDFATGAPQLPRLIDILTDRIMRVIEKWLQIGVDVVHFHTDIGHQTGLMISPEQFRHYIKPMFRTLFGVCRQAGSYVYLCSEGNVLAIVDDLIECGVSVHDPELEVCGLEAVERVYKGKLCTMIYINPQRWPEWTPSEVRAHVRDVITRLGSAQGGLMLAACATPDVPLENIEAMALAIEEYRTYWWDGRG